MVKDGFEKGFTQFGREDFGFPSLPGGKDGIEFRDQVRPLRLGVLDVRIRHVFACPLVLPIDRHEVPLCADRRHFLPSMHRAGRMVGTGVNLP